MVYKYCIICLYKCRTQYGLYQDAVNLCKSTNKAKWSNAIYWVFDTPSLADKPYEVYTY